MLEKASKELGEFQRRTFDYVTKFGKIAPQKAEKLTNELMEKFELDRRDAIQITNCMPTTLEEVRTILAVKGRVVPTAQLEDILKVVDDYKEK